MKKITFTLFLFLSGLTIQLSAQDIHWTMYNMSPLTLNPSLTGAYLGTARVGGIYRAQALGLNNVTGYTTPSAYVDAPILNVGKKDWIGIGAYFYADEAGSASLKNQGAYGSIAYHKVLDKKGNTMLSFGLQGGYLSRSIDQGALRFGDEVLQELVSGSFNPNAENRQNLDDSGSFDMNAGVSLTARLGKLSDLNIGVSFYHLLSPDYGLNTANEPTNAPKGYSSLPMRFQAHGQLNAGLGEQWMISPTFLFNQAHASNELQVQALLGYIINKEDPMVIKLGPGYRVGDAVQFILNAEYKSFKFGASYDLTTSDLNTLSGNANGFELALSYVIKIFKAPTVKPVVICPRL